MKKALLIALALVNTTTVFAASTSFKCYAMESKNDLRNIKDAKVRDTGFYTYSIDGKKATVTYTKGAQSTYKAKKSQIDLNDYKGLSSLNLRTNSSVDAFIIDEFSKENPTVIVDKKFVREYYNPTIYKSQKYDIYFGEVYMKNAYNAKAPNVLTLGCIKL